MAPSNPILDMLNQSKNPQVPNNLNAMQQAMNYVNQNGGDPKSAFFKLAKEKGVDPTYILNMLMKR